MQNNSWARLLAYVTGLVNQGLLLQSECLIAENRILRRSHVSGRLRLSDGERLYARRRRSPDDGAEPPAFEALDQFLNLRAAKIQGPFTPARS